jgi:hypothetical protein
MTKGQLFEYAVLFHPKQSKEQAERGESPKSELLVPPTRIVATSDKEVAMKAARDIPATHIDKLEDIEVVVRPF